MRRFIFLLLILTFGLSHASSAILTRLDGQNTSFASLRGQWVFINYWASWCQPCLDEIGQLNQFYQQQKGKAALYAVNFDGLPIAEQKSLMSKVGIQYPALSRDPGPDLGLGYIRGVPVTFVFNPKGELADTLYGGQTLASLNQAMK
ncbi:TlpA disulfide reductase family protein [Legionella sp. CNM-4043-24]|uniref:TlpA disulfide reductase family protein n=1 Tax=Legionella sp. CNM-4043-24 TaxID=3421646 RepID=UPI00403AFF66